jgi:hypothetical protein
MENAKIAIGVQFARGTSFLVHTCSVKQSGVHRDAAGFVGISELDPEI